MSVIAAMWSQSIPWRRPRARAVSSRPIASASGGTRELSRRRPALAERDTWFGAARSRYGAPRYPTHVKDRWRWVLGGAAAAALALAAGELVAGILGGPSLIAAIGE